MTKITRTVSADVPSDPERCVNWAFLNGMPPEQNFRCAQLQDASINISDRDAQSSGLGVSGGTISSFVCKLFDRSLRHKFGDGVFKCDECKAAIEQSSPEQPQAGQAGKSWPEGAAFTDGEGNYFDAQAEPLPGNGGVGGKQC